MIANTVLLYGAEMLEAIHDAAEDIQFRPSVSTYVLSK